MSGWKATVPYKVGDKFLDSDEQIKEIVPNDLPLARVEFHTTENPVFLPQHCGRTVRFVRRITGLEACTFVLDVTPQSDADWDKVADRINEFFGTK